jgi:hypothetical protein
MKIVQDHHGTSPILKKGNQGRNKLYLRCVFASGLAEPKSLTLTASEARATVILENLVMPKLRTSEEALTFVILLRQRSHTMKALYQIKPREMQGPASLQFN